MGVTGLWEVVQPCARPIKIDTLNKKRLAIDASIWVYHFLKAVRDKEGNALRNSHVVGFYRRICKLLFFGIKPVFVFDGGAPSLKRQTITARKARREGRREDASRTAGKLLALQMQRRAEEDEQRRREERDRTPEQDGEEPVPENPVYVSELAMTDQERQQNRKFRKKDQYHLPDLSVPLSEMGGANDPRVMSMEDLQQYAKQFETGEDINVYDFSKIDFDSPFFVSLPATDRYNILNAARMRSRLRMGYSRDQLESMFPDRMEFSRFQIERVRERNDLTQRLMLVGTAEEGTILDGNGRIAGEKAREYVLVKNPDVEGGWALGVIGDKDKEEGERNRPIDIEEKARQAQLKEREEMQEYNRPDSDEEDDVSEEIQKRREAFYEARRKEAGYKGNSNVGRTDQTLKEDDDSLFVSEAAVGQAEHSAEPTASINEDDSEDEEAQLQIALAMSLESGNKEQTENQIRRPDLPKQVKAKEHNPFTGAKGSVASIANARSLQSAPKADEPTGSPKKSDSDGADSDDEVNLTSVLASSRRSPQAHSQAGNEITGSGKTALESDDHKSTKFDGPLPFEKLDLGSSLLGKKKMKQIEENTAGGFVKDDGPNDKDNSEQPPPPWFAADVERGMQAQREMAVEDRKQAEQVDEDERLFFQSRPTIRSRNTNEVIDVDALDEKRKDDVVELVSSDDEIPVSEDAVAQDHQIRMGDVADMTRVEAPVESTVSSGPINMASSTEDNVIKTQQGADDGKSDSPQRVSAKQANDENALRPSKRGLEDSVEIHERSDEELEWEDSETERGPPTKRRRTSTPGETAMNRPSMSFNSIRSPPVHEDHAEHGTHSQNSEPVSRSGEGSAAMPSQQELGLDLITERDDSPDDLYVPGDDDLAAMAAQGSSPTARVTSPGSDADIIPMSGAADQNLAPNAIADQDEVVSDDEDDELMAQLAMEAEEHARFTSTFNNKSTRQNIEDYERELKALRSQQKKDRRDADEVTHIMIQECQQLLKLFGLPYVTAPMEAEAQCAELVTLGLVDGIVTDDSDCFLFGGTRIYKNMFNQAKFVECYLASDLERDFDLTRQKMINVAHLLGSDYTEGIPGVGPVTALEILTDFPQSLDDFRDWFTGIQQGAPTTDADKNSSFRRKFRKQATKIILPPNFPDKRVDLAYNQPEVDSDPSTFQWGVPDLDALRSFLMSTIGWTPARTDEVLVPVIRDMNRRENEGTQANITAFMGDKVTTGAGAFAPRVRGEGKSKRMEAALERMAERARKRRKGAAVADAQEEAVIATSGSGVDGSAGVTIEPRSHRADATIPNRKNRNDEETNTNGVTENGDGDSKRKRKDQASNRGKQGKKRKNAK